MVFVDSTIAIKYFATEGQSEKAFSTIATMARMHLVSMLVVNELLQNTKRTWARIKNGSGLTTPNLFAPLK